MKNLALCTAWETWLERVDEGHAQRADELRVKQAFDMQVRPCCTPDAYARVRTRVHRRHSPEMIMHT